MSGQLHVGIHMTESRAGLGAGSDAVYLLHVPEMEPQALGRPGRSLVTLPTTQHEGRGNRGRANLIK